MTVTYVGVRIVTSSTRSSGWSVSAVNLESASSELEHAVE